MKGIEYRPAHSLVELECTLLQRDCGKRSDLQVANWIMHPITILFYLVTMMTLVTRIIKMK